MMRLVTFVFLLVAFAAASYASGCGSCHGSPPDDRSHRIHSGLKEMKASYGDAATTAQFSSDAKAYGFNCGNCHPQKNNHHEDGVVEIDLARAPVGLKAMNSTDARYDSVTRKCSGVYCHSTGELRARIHYVTSPQWNREEKGSRCHECHDSPPVYKSMPDRPNGHFNSDRGSGHLLGIHWDSTGGHTTESFRFNTATQMGCSTCHYETVRRDRDMDFVDSVTGLFTCVRCHQLGNGEIYNYSKHVNGKVDISFNPVKMRSKAQMMRPPHGWKRKGAKGKVTSYDEAVNPLSAIQYGSDEKSCSNVPCHISTAKVFWRDTVNCGQCHERFMGKEG